MKQRIYIDTSVAGGYFDKEFSDGSKKFFQMAMNGEVVIIISSILEAEIIDAPIKVQRLIEGLPQNYIEKVSTSDKAIALAEKYIKAKVVGKTSLADCLHIAIATLAKADLLVSWNFKHIVNVQRINGYNSVNLECGYKIIDIRTPMEVLRYEK